MTKPGSRQGRSRKTPSLSFSNEGSGTMEEGKKDVQGKTERLEEQVEMRKAFESATSKFK